MNICENKDSLFMSQNEEEYQKKLVSILIKFLVSIGSLCLIVSFSLITNFPVQAIVLVIISSAFLIMATIKSVEGKILTKLEK